MDVINKAETFPAFLSRNLCTFNFSRYLRWKFCVKLALEAKPTFVQCPHPHHNSDVESEERQTESGGWRGSTQCCHTSLLHNSHRCLLWKELLCLTGDKRIAFHKTIESTVPRISSTQADMESTCLVLFLFTITHTAQALIVPLPGLSISSKHFLTLLNIPGRSDRGVSADVADCGSNHILCTSQVFVKEQPRNEIFSGWRRLLL